MSPFGLAATQNGLYLHPPPLTRKQGATAIITCFGLGSAVGVIGGGYFGQRLYNYNKEWMPLVSGLCVFAGIPPMLFLVNLQLNK